MNSTASSSNTSKYGSVSGFDPEALERGAKAARELDGSKNAKLARDIIVAQETTNQKQAELQRAQYMAHQQELAIQRVREEEEAASRTLEKKRSFDRENAEYKDQLERRKTADEINAQRYLKDEERVKDEESLLRKEAIRRKTMDHEAGKSC